MSHEQVAVLYLTRLASGSRPLTRETNTAEAHIKHDKASIYQTQFYLRLGAIAYLYGLYRLYISGFPPALHSLGGRLSNTFEY